MTESNDLNKMDLINFLEILSQWEAFVVEHGSKISPSGVALKLKLEQVIMKL